MIALLLAVLSSAFASTDEFVLVVNPDVPVPALNEKGLRRLLSKQECCWPDGLEVALILPPSTDEATIWLTREILGLEPVLYRRYMLERCYRMGCTPLVETANLKVAQDVAFRTPGAITIARRDEVPEGLRELVLTE